jgi:hypothetical protein
VVAVVYARDFADVALRGEWADDRPCDDLGVGQTAGDEDVAFPTGELDELRGVYLNEHGVTYR